MNEKKINKEFVYNKVEIFKDKDCSVYWKLSRKLPIHQGGSGIVRSSNNATLSTVVYQIRLAYSMFADPQH